MTREEITTIIEAAITAAPCPIRTGGWGVTLVKGPDVIPHWEPTNPKPSCCPLGAVLLQCTPIFGEESVGPVIGTLRHVLDVSSRWIDGFVVGFDHAAAPVVGDGNWAAGYSLGQEFRNKLVAKGKS
jgi:hypothetical protein